MLKLEGLSKVYKVGTFGGQELRAVSEVDFEVKKGEVVSLIGESGSGKSTIGKMILRLVPVTSGAIRFKGEDVTTLKGAALKEYYRKVQGVFQDPFGTYNPIFKADRTFHIIREEFYPDVEDEVWEQKVEDALCAVGLNPENCLDKFPHQLSGGQLQRLLIARALLLDIEFLVADEIISMLDASTRIDVLNLLADLKARGLSILFITHDLSLGYYISEKAAILYRGQAVEMGATEKIYANPLHPYTKMLMASVPRLDKKWEAEQGSETAVKLKAKTAEPLNGCPYFDRCTIADRSLGCDSRRPPLLSADEDHQVACFYYQQVMGTAVPNNSFTNALNREAFAG
jgi:peptide/nickel transport system ATP-binding protein